MPVKSSKDVLIRTFWGEPFYRTVLQPFDGWRVEPKPSAAFDPRRRAAQQGLPGGRRRQCTLAPRLRRLGVSRGPRTRFTARSGNSTRRYTACGRCGAWHRRSTALGIGCGHEKLDGILPRQSHRAEWWRPISMKGCTSAAKARPTSSNIPKGTRRSITELPTSRCGA